MCNGGGGIFRFIKGPSDLPELEEYFEVKRDMPIDKYALAFDFEYFEASNQDQLEITLPQFFDSKRPSILAVKTPQELNAEILRGYFKRAK